MNTDEKTKAYVSRRFGISLEEILFYNSGCCYSRIIVSSKRAANKVSKSVKGQTANGGWFHGMPLGGITKQGKCFEVTC